MPPGVWTATAKGLLVLTNDGALQAKLTQPGKRTGKIYYVQVEGEPDEADAITAQIAQRRDAQRRPHPARRY